MSIESVILPNHLIFFPFLLLLPSIFPSIKVFSSELALHIRWSKYWSFSFSNSPSNEYSGLISFRIDWFNILEVQGTLKSLPEHYNSKASFMDPLYGPTLTSVHDYWKNHSFDYVDLGWKMMPVLFNMLFSFALAFLPRSKCPLISWLQLPSTVILEPRKIKSVTASTFSPSI